MKCSFLSNYFIVLLSVMSEEKVITQLFHMQKVGYCVLGFRNVEWGQPPGRQPSYIL